MGLSGKGSLGISVAADGGTKVDAMELITIHCRALLPCRFHCIWPSETELVMREVCKSVAGEILLSGWKSLSTDRPVHRRFCYVV